LPIFGFSRTFDAGRGAKIFLSLQGGLTRGAVPDLEQHERLENIIREQRKTLSSKDQQLKEQAENVFELRKQLKNQAENIFQLRNELYAMNDLVEKAQSTPSAPQGSGELEIGALPDFVVIGAMRGGTSQFYRLLVTQHPNVQRAATKEIHFFDRLERFNKGIEWYRRCFPPPEWRDGRRCITGEATPRYLSDPDVPERMAKVIPKAKLIVLLRNPVDRAYSHYQLSVRRGHETRSFEDAIREEQEARGPSDLLARSIYVDQLLRWRKFFNVEQMLVIKSENFFKHTTDTMQLVQDFLGLPYRKLELRTRRTSRGTEHHYQPMHPVTRRRLEAYFEPHNQRLYEYLGVDFGW
jgi:hypothetical protein